MVCRVFELILLSIQQEHYMEIELGGLANKQDIFEDYRDFDEYPKQNNPTVLRWDCVSLIVEQSMGGELSALLASAKSARRNIQFALECAGKVRAIGETNCLRDLRNGLLRVP